MNKVITIGPFLLQFNMLVLILALIVSYFVFKITLKKLDSAIFYAEIYMNAMLIWGVFWRLGSILWNIDVLIQNPLSILYLAGSEKTLWMGFLLACVYVFIKFRKNLTQTWSFIDLLFVPVLTFLTIYHLLMIQVGYETKLWWGIHISSVSYKYHPVNFYYLILELTLLIWFWIKSKNRLGYGIIFATILVLYGLGAFIISFTMPQRIFLIGLSQIQFVYAIMVLLGLVIYSIRGKVIQ